MNSKEEPATPSQNIDPPKVHINGGDYTFKEAEALAIAEHQRNNNVAAVDIYDRILAKFPFYAGGWSNRAVMLNLLRRCDEALASAERAIALQPGHAGFHSNRGDALRELGRYEEALVSYDTALGLKPDFFEPHNGRVITLQAMGRYEEALINADKAIVLRSNAAEAHNNRGALLRQMGRYEEALVSLNQAITLNPNAAEAYHNRGTVLQELKRHDDALASYDKAITLQPSHARNYNKRGDVLLKLKQYDGALASYDKAIELNPDYADAYHNRGNTLLGLKQYDGALASYDKAIAIYPDYAEVYASIGTTLVITGDMQGAEKMFLKALSLKPDLPKALFALTRFHTYQDADHADIKNIQALLGTSIAAPQDREGCYFSLGKVYDDCGLYDKAFECFQQANTICNTKVSYNSDNISRITDGTMEVFSKDFLAQPFAFASDSRTPLFIVGMPRSGTTLMASILSNHPSVGTAGELPTISELASGLPELTKNYIPYPQAVEYITPAIASRLINDYEKRLRRDIGSDVVHIIDKNPTNFRHLGFIAMLFPKAHIIHCTRNPLDTCLSNYFQWFGPDCDYSFDLRNIGHFYGEYTRIMEHWRKVLPTKMLEVRYEDVVMNTEPTARRTLAFLGLEWDERCLAPHTNPYAVDTTSSWQVRRPIYKESIERWRHYEKHISLLKKMLPL